MVLVHHHLASPLCQAMDSEPLKLSSGWALLPTLSAWAMSQIMTRHIFTKKTPTPSKSLQDQPAAGVFLPLVPDPDVWTQHRIWEGVCGRPKVGAPSRLSVLPEETQAHEEPILSSLCLLPSKSQSSLHLYSLSRNSVILFAPPYPLSPQLLLSGADPTLTMWELCPY